MTKLEKDILKLIQESSKAFLEALFVYNKFGDIKGKVFFRWTESMENNVYEYRESLCGEQFVKIVSHKNSQFGIKARISGLHFNDLADRSFDSLDELKRLIDQEMVKYGLILKN